jgi:hypothetical protein
MSRQHILNGVYVSEGGTTRQYVLSGLYFDEVSTTVLLYIRPDADSSTAAGPTS